MAAQRARRRRLYEITKNSVTQQRQIILRLIGVDIKLIFTNYLFHDVGRGNLLIQLLSHRARSKEIITLPAHLNVFTKERVKIVQSRAFHNPILFLKEAPSRG
jgi:hypothetical protein